MINFEDQKSLLGIWYENPPTSTGFEIDEFIRDPLSEVEQGYIGISIIGDLYTSMTFMTPNHPLPGLVKEVNNAQAWRDKLENRSIIVEGLVEGTIKRPLILARFNNNKLFILDGQKRALAIFESINKGIRLKYSHFPVIVLSNPKISQLSTDLKHSKNINFS